MIKGLFATVTSEELQQICLTHARRHRASAEQLGREKKRPPSKPPAFDDEDEDETLTWRDQQETQRLIGFHENRAADLEFLAGHLEAGESYRLGQHDRCYVGLLRPDSDFAMTYEDEFDEEVPF